MTAYYNEIDPFAAAWLRELIKAGHIAPGEVDERSIEDINPEDLKPYAQCHFFAGIGVWSYALRNAGWPDDKPVWTGSCPCQPFSSAGQGGGFADERHLWPAFFHLIRERCPAIVLGEQVTSKDGLGWLDLVQTDMEGEGYAFGAVNTCSAGHGAPHIRQRLRFAAKRLEYPAVDGRLEWRSEPSERGAISGREPGREGCEALGHGAPAQPDRGLGRLANADDARPQGRPGMSERAGQRTLGSGSVAVGLANATFDRNRTRDRQSGSSARPEKSLGGYGVSRGPTGPVNGFWRAADWLYCRDAKGRPVEPGAFPLVNGAPARVGRLRGYGNAVDAEATKAFVEAEATKAFVEAVLEVID